MRGATYFNWLRLYSFKYYEINTKMLVFQECCFEIYLCFCVNLFPLIYFMGNKQLKIGKKRHFAKSLGRFNVICHHWCYPVFWIWVVRIIRVLPSSMFCCIHDPMRTTVKPLQRVDSGIQDKNCWVKVDNNYSRQVTSTLSRS